MKLTAGRMFRFGSREVIAGSSVVHRFRGANLGETLKFGGDQWTIVGVFDTDGSGFDSEVWGDVDQLAQAFGRVGGYSSVTLRLADTAGGCNPDFDPFRRLPLTWYYNYPGESDDGLNWVNSHVVNIPKETSPAHFHPPKGIGACGGVPQREIEKLEESGKVQHDIEIDSPVSGYITDRNALPNQYVQADTKLYTIADLSTAWVYANVFQGDIGWLKPGNPAQVTLDAYPGRRFRGRIDQILPQVDPMTRTVRVRLVFANPGVVLKPGTYVNVNIAVPLGRQLVIPSSGLLQSGTRQIAFLDHGQGYLEPRQVEAGPQFDDHVVGDESPHVDPRVLLAPHPEVEHVRYPSGVTRARPSFSLQRRTPHRRGTM